MSFPFLPASVPSTARFASRQVAFTFRPLLCAAARRILPRLPSSSKSSKSPLRSRFVAKPPVMLNQSQPFSTRSSAPLYSEGPRGADGDGVAAYGSGGGRTSPTFPPSEDPSGRSTSPPSSVHAYPEAAYSSHPGSYAYARPSPNNSNPGSHRAPSHTYVLDPLSPVSPGKASNSFVGMPPSSPSYPSFSPAAFPTATPAPSCGLARALKSVVKIFCTSASPNYSAPWQMMSQTKSTATGFVINSLHRRQILTNAHAVANQIQVQVRKHGVARKFPAHVVAVGHECDVAMLTVDDEEFWEGVESLEIGGLPAMQESVTVVGFPQGGDNVCVTKGIVSRLDRQQYSHGRTGLLAVQIDAAINSGNSGGPVIKGDRVVGIAFQCLTSGDNIGYIIPVPVIDHFLEDLRRHEKYTGFCELGCAWQPLESSDMKRYLGMPRGMTGVFLTGTEPLFHASETLRPGDVLTHFNDHPIADDGTFLYQQSVRIDFRHLVSMFFDGEYADVKVWRRAEKEKEKEKEVEKEGKPMDGEASLSLSRPAKAAEAPLLDLPVTTATPPTATPPTATPTTPIMSTSSGSHLALKIRLSTPKQLVPVHSHDVRPSYFIYAGMVFTRLTNFYLRSTYGADWGSKAPIKLCDRSFAGSKERHGQEVVLLAKVLAAEVNQGFQDMGNIQVLEVNGVKVHNLAHLAHLLEVTFADEAFIRLNLEWRRVVVLDNRKARAQGEAILRQNHIPASSSPGLLEEWREISPHDLEDAAKPISLGDTEEIEDAEAEAVGGAGTRSSGARTRVTGSDGKKSL